MLPAKVTQTRSKSDMWNFQINNNGNTADDIKGRFVSVVEACHKLEGALQGLNEVVNGRNYQTLDNAHSLRDDDVAVLRGMIVAVRQVHDMSINGASMAIKHKNSLTS